VPPGYADAARSGIAAQAHLLRYARNGEPRCPHSSPVPNRHRLRATRNVTALQVGVSNLIKPLAGDEQTQVMRVPPCQLIRQRSNV
jgi:hypothetical protein